MAGDKKEKINGINVSKIVSIFEIEHEINQISDFKKKKEQLNQFMIREHPQRKKLAIFYFMSFFIAIFLTNLPAIKRISNLPEQIWQIIVVLGNCFAILLLSLSIYQISKYNEQPKQLQLTEKQGKLVGLPKDYKYSTPKKKESQPKSKEVDDEDETSISSLLAIMSSPSGSGYNSPYTQPQNLSSSFGDNSLQNSFTQSPSTSLSYSPSKPTNLNKTSPFTSLSYLPTAWTSPQNVSNTSTMQNLEQPWNTGNSSFYSNNTGENQPAAFFNNNFPPVLQNSPQNTSPYPVLQNSPFQNTINNSPAYSNNSPTYSNNGQNNFFAENPQNRYNPNDFKDRNSPYSNRGYSPQNQPNVISRSNSYYDPTSPLHSSPNNNLTAFQQQNTLSHSHSFQEPSRQNSFYSNNSPSQFNGITHSNSFQGNNSFTSPNQTPKYRTAYRSTESKKTSKEGTKEQITYANLFQAQETLTRLGISSFMPQYTENMRKWLVKQVLQPVVKLTKNLTTLGFDLEIDSSQIPQQFASNTLATLPPEKLPLMELVSKYGSNPVVQERIKLERYLQVLGCTSRQYLLQRIKDLAKGDYLLEYNWNGGSNWKGKKWTSELPTDAQIIIHLFCTFLDLHSIHGTPFTQKHFIVFPQTVDSNNNNGVLLRQAQIHPPHFHVILKGEPLEVIQGRNNLFHALILFVFSVQTSFGGYLGGIALDNPSLKLKTVLQ